VALTSWTPDLLGTASKPGLGSNPVTVGHYDVVSGRVEGYGLIRVGTGSRARGKGMFRLTLPVSAVSVDPQGFDKIGDVTIGWAVSGLPKHRSGTLHLCGLPGFEATNRAVIAPTGGGFVSDAQPFLNIHYTFGFWEDA
jgi:hypothetical protein